MKTKMLKAINEGVKNSLIQFDDSDDSIQFGKQKVKYQSQQNAANALVDMCIENNLMTKTEYSMIVANAWYPVKDKEQLKKLCQITIKYSARCNLNWIDTSFITDMSQLFAGRRSFNGNISKWDVSNVTDMSSMFLGCEKFNGDLSKWDVSNVKHMPSMFYGCTNFNSDLSKWDVSKVTEKVDTFSECPIKEEYKPVFGPKPRKMRGQIIYL